MPRWALLNDRLKTAEDDVFFSWSQLEALVGPLPASPSRHRAWWSGDRPHVRAWNDAGYVVSELAPGAHVRFQRRGVSVQSVHVPSGPELRIEHTDPTTYPLADVLLMACVKTKRNRPAAAKDLYVSPLFRKERTYAEAAGRPWFILSGEHGLVQPDEWLAPYERYLPNTPPSYQRAWALYVAERLQLLMGPLADRLVEVHASADYVQAIRGPLEAMGASLVTPLEGLAQGERLQWYDHHRGGHRHATSDAFDGAAHPQADDFVTALLDRDSALAPADFLRQPRQENASPGLYSWWVDTVGADDLSRGLGHQVEAGLIYAGLAGATRWPSGQLSRNTLWSRIVTMHLGDNHEFSTFRRTLGSILANARNDNQINEARLTRWMHEHLRVVAVPYADADTLGHLESTVLGRLGPVLNLQGMPRTPLRAHLRQLRRTYK